MSFSSGARQSSNETSHSRSVADAKGIKKRRNINANSWTQTFFAVISTCLEPWIVFLVARSAVVVWGTNRIRENPREGHFRLLSLFFWASRSQALQAQVARGVPA